MSDEGQEKQQRRDGYGNGNYMKSWIILMFSVYTPTRIRFGVGDSKHWLKSSTRNHILNVLFTLSIPHFQQETTTPWSMVDGGEWREVKTLSSLVDSRVIIIFFFNSTSSSTFSCTLCCLFEWSKSYRTSGYWLRKSSKEHNQLSNNIPFFSLLFCTAPSCATWGLGRVWVSTHCKLQSLFLLYVQSVLTPFVCQSHKVLVSVCKKADKISWHSSEFSVFVWFVLTSLHISLHCWVRSIKSTWLSAKMHGSFSGEKRLILKPMSDFKA